MSALAPTLEAFFTERLIDQRRASSNTVAAYRDAWRLLLRYAQDRIGKQPCQLDLADLDAPFVAGFLDHLETERSNSVRTRNARLAAIRSFFRYAALCHPEHAGLIARVLAIPTKRAERNELSYLDGAEVDALLATPDRDTWTGRRDHALIDVAVDTGLRVSELTGLRNGDVELGTGAHVTLHGQGPQAPGHSPAEGDRGRAGYLDARARGRTRRSALPDPSGNPDRSRSGGAPGGQARGVGRPALPVAARQTRHASRPAPQLRDVASHPRRRHSSDRSLARARARRNHADLRARRHVDQGASARTHRATEHDTGALPTNGLAARVPQRALIILNWTPPSPALTSSTREAGHNPAGARNGCYVAFSITPRPWPDREVGADLDEPRPELGVGDVEVVHPDPAFLFDEVEADEARDRRAVLGTEDPLELLGGHDGDDTAAALRLSRLEIGADVVELAVVPAGAVWLLQMQDRHVVFGREGLHVTAEAVPDLLEQGR